ncbi:hypothetical protein [Gelidibacter sp.]|uniref:hypothetical protein n=1 Tax=Gelidibacter sp. TaxID=2018083 RepID=UPI002B5E6EDA|nr:hypothetical protein [Gelidibacter sp.]HUH27078.1 hypothetical protein [Gelidibacter sp.]
MKKLVLLSAVIFGLVFYSCSSDDDNGTEKTVSLVGEWRLTNVDFITMTEGGRPASDACIVELVAGYEFRADSKAYFILGDMDRPFFDPYAQDYWTWEGDASDFKIVQTNPMSPPYNFSLSPKNIKTKQVDGKVVMTFQSIMGNGSEANFTLVKEAIDKSKTPLLTDDEGGAFYCGFFDPQ